MMINPVRYPGGKGRKSIVDRILSLYPEGRFDDVTWIEPFCGGCGLGLALLERGMINRAVFNDSDMRISDMWHTIAYDADEMIYFIENIDIDMPLFWKAKETANSPESSRFERGIATFILNRCCRSGYIDGGVIGGNDQTGKYKVDSRFNKKTLIGRIRSIGKLASDGRIMMTEPMDAVDMIRGIVYDCDDTHIEHDYALANAYRIPDDASDIFIYADPPYYENGPSCYRNTVDHVALSDVLAHDAYGNGIGWFLSYDDNDEIRRMYSDMRIERLDITYTNNEKTRGRTSELLITDEC